MLANAEKPPVTGVEVTGVFGVVEGVGFPKTEDRPKTGVEVEGVEEVVAGVSKADTFTGVVVGVACAGLKNGELLSIAPKTLSPSEKVDCLRLANTPPAEDGLSAAGFPKGDGDGLCPIAEEDVVPMAVRGLGESGEDAGDGVVTSCWDLPGVLGRCFGWSRMAAGSGFSGGAKTDSGFGLASVCESFLSSDHAGFVGVGPPRANREGVELLHAPKPPDEGLMRGADGVGGPNEVWPKVDPNAGCPKAGVVLAPKPVCPKPVAGFGACF